VTDAEANVEATYEMDAYGNPRSSTGILDNAFRFVGAYGVRYDSVTGLYYMRARWYDPEVGRFIGRDPSPRLGKILYEYTHNNPSIFIDSFGDKPIYTPDGKPVVHADRIRPDPQIMDAHEALKWRSQHDSFFRGMQLRAYPSPYMNCHGYTLIYSGLLPGVLKTHPYGAWIPDIRPALQSFVDQGYISQLPTRLMLKPGDIVIYQPDAKYPVHSGIVYKVEFKFRNWKFEIEIWIESKFGEGSRVLHKLEQVPHPFGYLHEGRFRGSFYRINKRPVESDCR
jgi:RHS repeat-associated protein